MSKLFPKIAKQIHSKDIQKILSTQNEHHFNFTEYNLMFLQQNEYRKTNRK